MGKESSRSTGYWKWKRCEGRVGTHTPYLRCNLPVPLKSRVLLLHNPSESALDSTKLTLVHPDSDVRLAMLKRATSVAGSVMVIPIVPSEVT